MKKEGAPIHMQKPYVVLKIKQTTNEVLTSCMHGAERLDFIGIDADHFESIEKSRGRIEERLCTAIDASDLIESQEWKTSQNSGQDHSTKNRARKI